MASNSGNFTINFISFLLLLILVANTVNAVPEHELKSMLKEMRARGYNLFANAIATSDINYEVISGTAFTFFAPINSSLFALDMTTTAADYVTTLRCHVMPRRFSLADLRRFPSRSSVPTLLPGRDAVVERSTASDAIAVDGVQITMPGLFYGRDVAVHGLGGLISFRSPVGSRQRSYQMIHPRPNVTGSNTSDNVPPPARSFSMSHPPPTFTGNHPSGYVPPPPARLSSMSHPPPNFTGNLHTSGHVPPPPAIFDENLEISNHTAASQLANTKGLTPVRSPVSPPEISPAPEPSSFSIGDTNPKDGSRALLSEFTSPNTNEPLLAGEISYSGQAMTHMPEEYSPLDEQTFDCLLDDDGTASVDHGSVTHGYLYTRQHYSVPSMTCS